MGAFKKWFEAALVGSSGQPTNPTQTQQATADIAQNFMADPKNTPMLNKVVGAQVNPSTLPKNALYAASMAAKQSGLQQDQFRSSTPAIASNFLSKLTPNAPNKFDSTIKPVV